MMTPTVDVRGLLCPKPVLKCKEFIENNSNIREFIVLVDNDASRENVVRFLTSKGFKTSISSKDKEFEIKAIRDDDTPLIQEDNYKISCSVETTKQEDKQLVLITSDFIGHGDEELGKKLMKNFISTLHEMGNSLWRIILINGGVKLSIKGSFVVEELKRLENSGVSILVCGTCLDHFDILNKKEVGETTNMLDVVTSLQLASKVIKI